jgi:hypothetical protein
MVAITVSNPIKPRKAHEKWLTNTAHTKPHNASVLLPRRRKTSALDGAGGGGLSAMGRRIQDAWRSHGNSFHHAPRNLFRIAWFHCQSRPSHGLLFTKPTATMKTKTWMTLGALAGTCLIATAQDEQQRPNRPQRPMGPPPPELVKEFDKDGDGKLSEDERKAMHEAVRARMEERRKEMLAKYDTDGDGKLSPEEEAKAREARRAEMLKKYDKDGDGQLSEEERAAMPKPPRRPNGPGGPGHRRGPNGPGPNGPDGPPPAPQE